MKDFQTIPIIIDKKQLEQIKALLEKIESVLVENDPEPVVAYMTAKVLYDKLGKIFVESMAMPNDDKLKEESVPSFTMGQA